MHFTRNVHTVLGSMLLYGIFGEASVGCCWCYFCAGDIITKKKATDAQESIQVLSYQRTLLITLKKRRFTV